MQIDPMLHQDWLEHLAKKGQRKHGCLRKRSDILARLVGFYDKKNKTVLDWAWIGCLEWVMGKDNIEL